MISTYYDNALFCDFRSQKKTGPTFPFQDLHYHTLTVSEFADDMIVDFNLQALREDAYLSCNLGWFEVPSQSNALRECLHRSLGEVDGPVMLGINRLRRIPMKDIDPCHRLHGIN